MPLRLHSRLLRPQGLPREVAVVQEVPRERVSLRESLQICAREARTTHKRPAEL